MLVHDFIAIKRNEIPFKIKYDLVKKYKCIHVSDDIILNNHDFFQDSFITSWGYIENVQRGLAYHGITIILNENIYKFIYILNKFNYRDDVQKLIELCNLAVTEKKDIIHFGV